MNILIPHSWLLDHLETEANPEQISEYLSLCGPSVEHTYNREGESVFDIEVTTNRVDSMSVRGIAREAAVILKQFNLEASLKEHSLPSPQPQSAETLPIPKVVSDPNLNKRTIFVVLKNVKRTPTPEWMAKRLRQIDLNVHDSVIDITNYVTHELGHPCHAFDYDKLMATGGEIIITEAGAGENFTTLDGESFETVGGEVVFKNGEGEIIDLPSIKGTQNTSIDDSTSNVLLLMESIRADKVRFASMTHAIRTTAAQLMEKNVDPHLAPLVLNLGVKLYQELCQAEVASEVFDEFVDHSQPQTIKISLQKINNYLGLEIDLEKIVSILKDLDCQVETSGQELVVTPPTFRSDLNIPADIVEEIARIYGYHNLPSVIMDTTIPTSKQDGVNFDVENKIKYFLAHTGWQEIYNYSMVSEALALESGFSLEEHLKLQNELTEDKVYLRRSLLPSLSENIAANPNQSSLSVFEMAHVYHPQEGNLPSQELQLGMVSTQPYRLIKGTVEALLEQFFITRYEFEPSENASEQFAQTAQIKVDGNLIGQIGLLKNGLVGVDIAIESLLAVVKSHPNYQSLPKTAILFEDMTFTLPEKTLVGEVLSEMRKADSIIRQVEFKDTYQQNHTFTITYLDPTQNLSAQDIEPIRKKIAGIVSEKYNGKLVGKLD